MFVKIKTELEAVVLFVVVLCFLSKFNVQNHRHLNI